MASNCEWSSLLRQRVLSVLLTNSELLLLLDAGSDSQLFHQRARERMLVQPWPLWGAGPECLENWGKPWEGSRQLVCEPQFSLGTNGIQIYRHYATQHYRHDATYQTQFCMNMAATQMNLSYERLNTAVTHWFLTWEKWNDTNHILTCVDFLQLFHCLFRDVRSSFTPNNNRPKSDTPNNSPIIRYSEQQQSDNPILQTTTGRLSGTPNNNKVRSSDLQTVQLADTSNNNIPIIRYSKQQQQSDQPILRTRTTTVRLNRICFRDLLTWTGDVHYRPFSHNTENASVWMGLASCH
jgi:hypothetical protein